MEPIPFGKMVPKLWNKRYSNTTMWSDEDTSLDNLWKIYIGFTITVYRENAAELNHVIKLETRSRKIATSCA